MMTEGLDIGQQENGRSGKPERTNRRKGIAHSSGMLTKTHFAIPLAKVSSITPDQGSPVGLTG